MPSPGRCPRCRKQGAKVTCPGTQHQPSEAMEASGPHGPIPEGRQGGLSPAKRNKLRPPPVALRSCVWVTGLSDYHHSHHTLLRCWVDSSAHEALTAPFQTGPFHMQGLSSADLCRNERVRIVELLNQLAWEPRKSLQIQAQPFVQHLIRTCRAGKVSLCLHAVHEPLKHSVPVWKIYPGSSPSVPLPYAFGHQRMQRL